MKYLLNILFLGLFSLSASAQPYVTAVGVRIGNSFGVTASQRLLPRMTAEAIIQNDLKKTTYLHLLAKYHKPIVTKGFNAYFGGGLHLGTQNEVGGVAGIDGVVGVELTLRRINLASGSETPMDFRSRKWADSQHWCFDSLRPGQTHCIESGGHGWNPKNKAQKERQKKRAAKKKLRKGLFEKK